MSKKKERLLIFDLDGTLCDTKAVNYHAYREALEKYDYVLDYKYFCERCDGQYYKDFLPAIGVSDIEEQEKIHDIKKETYIHHIDKAIMNDRLMGIIDAAKETHYIAIVTTASKKNTMELLNRFQVGAKFDLVLTREDVEKHKPDPEGFRIAMQHFGVLPEKTLIFEDSESGLKAAQASGAGYVKVFDFM